MLNRPVTRVHICSDTATDNSGNDSPSPAEKEDGLMFPAKITKKRNYGYKVEWVDGACIIVDGGTILRKRKHPAPPLDDINPAFAFPYVESKHGERLR